MSINQNQMNTTTANDSGEIDLGKLLGVLLDNRWKIVVITFLFTVFGIAYAMLATPIYKADALIQVEEKSSGMPALGEMGDMFAGESSSTTEIEILKSRMILGKTVDKLNLTTVAKPDYLPYIGKGLSRIQGHSHIINISRFDIPDYIAKPVFRLTVLDSAKGTYTISDQEQRQLFTGEVGKLVQYKGFKLLISDLIARDGTVFILSKSSRLDAILRLQQSLAIREKGKKTGILQLSLTGESRNDIERILNDISQNYFLQNVARNAAEAENSLNFLQTNLPNIKNELTESEDALNRYRQENESIDLGLEAKSTLDVMVTLEAQLNELTFKESEISQRFTQQHPAYQSLLDKRRTLLSERERLNRQVQKLPKTQRQVLRLTRDVEVNQQIYVQLLNKVQELNIVKASTVGNVRILDEAQSYSHAIKPKKSLIVVVATLLGGVLSVALVLLRAALHRGVESPDQIEAIGLPVYASVPMSDAQIAIDSKKKGKRKLSVDETLLAEVNPADLSIEALRSLRTSLHFAMMEARNNILMISGPSPGIGKSFISANMSAVVAKGEQRVLLIDSDMRKGRMEKQMMVKNDVGLSDYLSGQKSIEELIKQPGVNNLDFICRGAVPPNPSELLMHPRFKELLEWASEQYDLVIVDTPPILAVTDPAIIGAHAGTTLMVGRFEQNPVKEIEVAKQRFEQNGIEVKGFILNAIVRKAGSAYSGSYGYYNYSYANDK